MNVPRSLAPLTMDHNHPRLRKAILRFLTRIWDCHTDKAVTFLATKRGPQWFEHPIRGDRRSAIARVLDEHSSDRWDIYFCPNAFSGLSRKTEYALSTCWAWCDIDQSDPRRYNPRPNILWETSVGSYQALWLWDKPIDPNTAEQVSKGLLRFGGDKGGWSITKMLRIPGTINHKPERNRDRVRLLSFDAKPKRLPIAPRLLADSVGPASSASDLDPSLYDPMEVKRRYRRAVGLVPGTLMTAKKVMRSDRSGAVFLVTSALLEAGANDDEIACVLLHNPYFTSKWGDNLGEAERQIARIRANQGADR